MRHGSDGESRPHGFGRGLASGVLLAGPGALGLVIILILPWPLSGADRQFEESVSAAPVCSGWHRGDGQSRAYDHDATERGYREFRESLSQTLSRSLRNQVRKEGPTGYDAGLPACRRSDRRKFRPEGKIPPEMLGKKLWFAEIKAGKQLVAPDLVRNDPGAILFATRVEKFELLAEASKSLDRPVSLAPRGLHQALGAQCVPAIVVISQEGEVEVHENP